MNEYNLCNWIFILIKQHRVPMITYPWYMMLIIVNTSTTLENYFIKRGLYLLHIRKLINMDDEEWSLELRFLKVCSKIHFCYC